MELYHTRKRIISSTLQSITRNGIHAFRVESLVDHLGISKKTIYRLFPSKKDLIQICLGELNEIIRRKIVPCTADSERNPMLRSLQFMRTYIEELYQPESIFWKDFQRLTEFRELFYSTWQEWQKGGEKILSDCKNKGYIYPDTDIPLMNKRLLTDLFESRLDGEAYNSQLLFYPIILRGIATDSGRLCLEENMVFSPC